MKFLARALFEDALLCQVHSQDNVLITPICVKSFMLQAQADQTHTSSVHGLDTQT